jgi:hypothetical protein
VYLGQVPVELDALNHAPSLVGGVDGSSVLTGGKAVGNELVELQLLQIGGRDRARGDGRNRSMSLQRGSERRRKKENNKKELLT